MKKKKRSLRSIIMTVAVLMLLFGALMFVLRRLRRNIVPQISFEHEESIVFDPDEMPHRTDMADEIQAKRSVQ